MGILLTPLPTEVRCDSEKGFSSHTTNIPHRTLADTNVTSYIHNLTFHMSHKPLQRPTCHNAAWMVVVVVTRGYGFIHPLWYTINVPSGACCEKNIYKKPTLCHEAFVTQYNTPL
ncbi:hypothetical protein Pcinc_041869 [Petrolisthes cinctipes]|uniref:Uncharacterized protein n=1 Tax=Petrolisthes cinctipes TaxID=88211 RepID=A0AAE1BL60_PETCI|nr:hypothetical protein Pcinc_041869 [Petrolisthes cinctipes]